jgi:hypothetical protein
VGMFTTFLHPDDGRELQVKCGYDELERYRVGDRVDQKPIPDWPGSGKLLDGVHDSWSDRGADDFVVIRNGVYDGVVPRGDMDLLREDWVVKYGEFPFPKRDLWTEEAWAEYDRRNQAFLERAEALERGMALVDAEEGATAGQSSLARSSFGLSRLIDIRRDYASIGRRLFGVSDLDALPAESSPSQEALDRASLTGRPISRDVDRYRRSLRSVMAADFNPMVQLAILLANRLGWESRFGESVLLVEPPRADIGPFQTDPVGMLEIEVILPAFSVRERFSDYKAVGRRALVHFPEVGWAHIVGDRIELIEDFAEDDDECPGEEE